MQIRLDQISMALEQQPALPKLHKSPKFEKISIILSQVVLLLEGLDHPWPPSLKASVDWISSFAWEHGLGPSQCYCLLTFGYIWYHLIKIETGKISWPIRTHVVPFFLVLSSTSFHFFPTLPAPRPIPKPHSPPALPMASHRTFGKSTARLAQHSWLGLAGGRNEYDSSSVIMV